MPALAESPAPPDLISFSCWSCHVELSVPMEMAGVSGPCPHCGVTLKAPPARPTAPLNPDEEVRMPEELRRRTQALNAAHVPVPKQATQPLGSPLPALPPRSPTRPLANRPATAPTAPSEDEPASDHVDAEPFARAKPARPDKPDKPEKRKVVWAVFGAVVAALCWQLWSTYSAILSQLELPFAPRPTLEEVVIQVVKDAETKAQAAAQATNE